MADNESGCVTVRFLGVWFAGSGSRQVEIPIQHEVPVHDLLLVAIQTLGVAQSVEQISESCMVLVQGRNIKDSEGWETSVQPGSRVSVVPLVGGG